MVRSSVFPKRLMPSQRKYVCERCKQLTARRCSVPDPHRSGVILMCGRCKHTHECWVKFLKDNNFDTKKEVEQGNIRDYPYRVSILDLLNGGDKTYVKPIALEIYVIETGARFTEHID